MGCVIKNIVAEKGLTNVVYGLLEPTTNEIRYVGKATDLDTRVRKHLQPSKLIENTHKNNWLKKLINQNEKPLVVVLKKCEDEKDLNQSEIQYINEYKTLGCKLTNATEGGDGGRMSDESLFKMRETKRLNKQEPFWLNKKLSEEHCKNISEGKKGYTPTENTKIKLSETHKGLNTWSKGKKLSKETISKMIESRIGKPKNDKPVHQLDFNGNIIKTWDAPYYAENELKLARNKIDMVCKGKRKSTGGFKWKYVNEK